MRLRRGSSMVDVRYGRIRERHNGVIIMTSPPISDIRIYRIAGRTVGALKYGEHRAILSLDQKTPLLRKGVVFLHPAADWSERLEPATIKADPENGIGQDETYTGAIIDDRVAAIVQELQQLRDEGRDEDDPRFMGAFDQWPDLEGE